MIELFVETKEVDRLAELVRGATDAALKAVSHYGTEPAARKLYYDAALNNVEGARDCYLRAGLAAEWEETVQNVCAAHFRKSGFIGDRDVGR